MSTENNLPGDEELKEAKQKADADPEKKDESLKGNSEGADVKKSTETEPPHKGSSGPEEKDFTA